jgi:hypothetical protein
MGIGMYRLEFKSDQGRMSLFLVALFALLAIGCTPSTAQPVAAKGVVKTKGGQPCEGAFVVFHPQEKERINDPKPVATADSQGNFVLTTFAQNDGAIPGEYGITIVWPAKAGAEKEFSLSGEGGSGGADQLAGRYGNPKAPVIKISVPKEGAQDLQLIVE